MINPFRHGPSQPDRTDADRAAAQPAEPGVDDFARTINEAMTPGGTPGASAGQPAAGPGVPGNTASGAVPGGTGEAQGTAAPELAALQQQLAEARAKADAHYDSYVRSQADIENVRRRASEDVAKAHKFSIESFAESLLPVRDSLEMALKADKPSVDSLRTGVEVTLKQLASVFERNKLHEINPAGVKFDPNLHQAISMVPGTSVNPPVAPNHVVSVLQKGYLINDRILRPAAG